ncbi:hypothetical protein [Sphingomonas sp. M1-B02]|uniref:hypothetical protein n=1 Tax=Sphingomonas sp. M1-B02 TaxID=3114300 RepID=UPI00223F88A4|nr:hypothetical protein [Sphingomonas sp. S6-11]UZK65901.1 hypothetical protein OKW87_15540 [Sphingomonas sp. S6-11]
MRKTLLLPLALLALSACNSAQNEAAEANEILTGDSNTMGEAVSDVNAANAATDAAFGAAENAYVGNAVEETGPAGNEIID